MSVLLVDAGTGLWRAPGRGLYVLRRGARADWGAASRFATGGEPAQSMEDEPMHFEQDIKPLFRERDRNAMRFAFDLWTHDDVSTHADAILGRLEAGTMPCDGPWPAERVAVFRQWIDGGKPA